jgi:endonuclease/exonuclease/phosphatase family metal-dependent hydrolase
MRLATYNVENLFSRARALNLDTWADGRKILEAYAELNALFEEAVYTPEIKARILAMMGRLGIDKKNESTFVILRETRGNLTTYSRLWGTRVVANGRSDWVGWLELKTELVNERATQNSAQVVRDVAADVIAMVEVEHRQALMQFSRKILPIVKAASYDEIMLIDGNDERGIDVGIMARDGYKLGWMRSHVDNRDARGGTIFSRDCPEYSIWTPSGAVIWVLVNHFKSKGYGAKEASDARRYAQAEAVRVIIERLKSEGATNIAIVGDLNDTPDSEALAPLLKETDFKDISTHPTFKPDGHLGTYGRGTAKDKFDYILLSPDLYERMTGGGVWRKGVWGPNKVPPWDIYPEMRSSYDAASDHAALWCDLKI